MVAVGWSRAAWRRSPSSCPRDGWVSGSAVADAAMEARILGPGMMPGLRQGYSARQSPSARDHGDDPPSIASSFTAMVGKSVAAGCSWQVLIPAPDDGVLMATAYAIAKRRGYVLPIAPNPRSAPRAATGRRSGRSVPGRATVAIRGGGSRFGGRSFAVVYALAVVSPPSRADAEEGLASLRARLLGRGSDHAIILMSGMVGLPPSTCRCRRISQAGVGGHHRAAMMCW